MTRLWLTLIPCRSNEASAKRPGPMPGGCSRWRCFSVFPPSSFIRPGRRFRAWPTCTTTLQLLVWRLHGEMAAPIISRRFISPEFWGIRRTPFGTLPAWWPAWAAVLAGVSDSVGAGRLPVHLLLLSRRLLQGVLGRPDQLRRRRAAQDVSSANAISRSSSKTSTATSCIWRSCSSFILSL